MKWKTALMYALSVWLVIIAAACALALYTSFLVEVGTTEALKRLGIVAGVALPLIAWLIKKAVGDFDAFRAIWGSGQDHRIAIEATVWVDPTTYLSSDFVHAA